MEGPVSAQLLLAASFNRVLITAASGVHSHSLQGNFVLSAITFYARLILVLTPRMKYIAGHRPSVCPRMNSKET